MLFGLLSLATACQQRPPDASLPSPGTVEAASASSDAQLQFKVAEAIKTALLKQDYRLLGLRTKLLSVPAVPVEMREVLLKRCGVRLLDWNSDSIVNNQQRAKHQAAVTYARRYNRQMLSHCRKLIETPKELTLSRTAGCLNNHR